MLKKRYIVGIALLFFMIIAITGAVEDVSAAKYKKFDSRKYSEDGVIVNWNAYYNGKNVKANIDFYVKKGNKKVKYGI